MGIRAVAHESLVDLVRDRADRDASSVAVTDGATVLTYGDLERESSRLAHVLASRGLRPGDRVVLLLPRSAAAICAIFAVLKCRGVYVPLDTASPPARLRPRIAAAGPRFVIGDASTHRLLRGCWDDPSAVTVWLTEPPPDVRRPQDVAAAEIQAAPATSPAVEPARGDLAYLLFTSGSTGMPKGVPITHGSVLCLASWAREHFRLTGTDRLSCHSALSFDFSVLDVYSALAAGASLHMVPAQYNLVPDLLARFIRESRLTQWSSVPSVLMAMANRGVVRDMPELRRVVWCGDAFPVDGLRHWMANLPHVRFTNLYGPTEATVASSYHDVGSMPASGADVPIGTALPGERLGVFDEHRRPVPTGVVGDLHIAGVGLSPGYWRSPAETAAAFGTVEGDDATRWYRTGDRASIDEDGLAHFHGRADRQIKARGYRVELDEIARVARGLPEFADVAVVAVDSPEAAGREIGLAYVAAGDRPPDHASVRAELARMLPPYMLPTRWLAVDAIDTNSNGKIDYPALTRRFPDGADATPPRTET